MKKQLTTTLWIFSIFTSFLISCNKISNELNPYEDEVKFNKTVDYNGTTLLTISVTQQIVIGKDSLSFQITNPTNSAIDSMRLLFYVQKADQFDKTLDYADQIVILNLAAGKDTTISILNFPELPISESELYIRLLYSSEVINNPISGYYNGQAGYFFDQDTVPSQFSFLKGFIEADGTSSFWMKLDESYKKLDGQFIDTLDLNALYGFGSNSFSTSLDTFNANTKFLIEPTKIHFRTNLIPSQNDIEKKVQLTLFK